MSDKLDLGLKDFSQLVSGAAILLSFFAGYKYGLRNGSASEAKQTKSKSEQEPATAEGLRVSVIQTNLINYSKSNPFSFVITVTAKCY